MTCGASNVSFGMPARHALGSAFLPMAMTAGLTSAIMDTRTPEIVEAVKAADLLLGHDEWGGNWIAAHRARQAREAAAAHERHRVTDGPDFSLADVRREGLIEPPGSDQATHDGTGRVDIRSPPLDTVAGTELEPTHARRTRPARRHRLRLGVVERHRDRLHLRRPRHLPQVQGPGRGRHGADHPARRPHLQPGPDRPGLAARLPRPGDPRPQGRGPAAHHPAEGGDRRRRPAGDPAAGPAEAVRRARRADPLRPAHRPGPADRRDHRPRADRRPARAAAAGHGAARGRLQGDRRDRRRGPDRHRGGRHDRAPLRHRLRPRHHHRRGDPARPRHRYADRGGVDAQQAAAVRRRRDQPDQRHHDRPRHARPAPAGGRRHPRRAGPPGVPRGRRRPVERLRGRDRRQRHDDRARAGDRARSRSASRRS